VDELDSEDETEAFVDWNHSNISDDVEEKKIGSAEFKREDKTRGGLRKETSSGGGYHGPNDLMAGWRVVQGLGSKVCIPLLGCTHLYAAAMYFYILAKSVWFLPRYFFI
jgi:hypothetical protein